MTTVDFRAGPLTSEEQNIVNSGFIRHSTQSAAPLFQKDRLSWLAHAEQKLVGVLTADLLWDWLYIDELWVDESQRGRGLGKLLMEQAENHVRASNIVGLWLWTQSWQAADFYKHLGYSEFTRFEDFPRGHYRIGLRKQVSVKALR